MRSWWLATIAAMAWVVSAVVSAHVVPADVTVRIFVTAKGDRLRYLVRMPMASVNDIDWPVNKADGTLILAAIEPALRDAATQWLSDYTQTFENGATLPHPSLQSVRLSLEGDGAFETYDSALAHVIGPVVPADTKLLPTQGMLDALFEYPIRSARSSFSIHPRLDRLGLNVTTVLAFVAEDGSVRRFEYEGGDAGIIHLEPLWSQAVSRFAQAGFFHVLGATDLLLLLGCLILPFGSGMRPSAAAFIAGQSVTLALSVYGFAPRALWFAPLVAALIAAATFLLCLEAIVGARLGRRPWLAYACGAVYGFALEMILEQSLQFSGSHGVAAVVSFAAGSAAGEILALWGVALAIEVAWQFVAPRTGIVLLSAIAAHSAWHRMADRYDELRRFHLGWPSLDLIFAIGLLRWAIVGVALAGVLWLGRLVLPALCEPLALFDEAADGGGDRLSDGLSGESRG